MNALDLSSDQKIKTDALFEKATADIKTARQKNLDRAEMGQKMRDVFSEVREGLKGILTPEQGEALAKQLPGNRPRGSSPQMLERIRSMMDQLSLTDDQRKQVADVLKDAHGQFEKIRNEAQGGGTDAREKVRAALQETRQKLEAILNPEQKEKLQEIRKQQPAPGTRPTNPNDTPGPL